ncbi:DNA-binding transcriptional regulator, MarR family [Chryseobacterium taichungense]|uniref:DNA-binding transcriptional regulator, MarR family n=1 Tax=Chryseobacterium taichungense TaxID=295069 RepID=A0A1H7YHY2_9FLAO|nr:MarR family transcriptional regulator [Chryseobacterium taichungense]SEM45842.1 DNA-binding transcriptional regulator, MarR family [Chryseobacterium taichungense]
MKFEKEKDLARISELMDIIRNVRKAMRSHFMKKMKEHQFDVTIEMLEVLYILWSKDNINQQEIVDKTNRNKASITSLIDNMTARMLVQRIPDPTDRRNNLIALTKEGRNYQEKLIPLLKEVYQSFQMDISSEELENTINVLQKINIKMME